MHLRHICFDGRKTVKGVESSKTLMYIHVLTEFNCKGRDYVPEVNENDLDKEVFAETRQQALK